MREGWPEVADFNDNIMKVGLAGETLAYREFPLTLYRHDGRPEQGWLNLDYSPLLDETGKPVGVMAIVVEITGKILIERELEAERKSLKTMFEQAPGFMAMATGPDHRFVMTNEAYRNLISGRDVIGKTVAEALPEVVEQGFIKLLDQVYKSGTPYVGRSVPVILQQGTDGALLERSLDFIYQPIVADDGQTTGIFIQGHDVTEQRATEQAIIAESRKLDVLNRTGAAVAAKLDIDKIVQIVTDACTELVSAQFASFFYNVINESGESYTLYALSGVSRAHFDKFPMPRKTAVFGPTFQGTGVVRSDDILKDPRYGKNAPHYGMPKGHLPVRSYLAVPVISRCGEVIGGLFFGHEEPAKFVDEHEELLTGIAGQAATAIDNARLFQSAERELTERRRAEEALQTLNNTLEQRVFEEVYERSKVEEQLRQVQKMEAVGQLTGGIAHDFNNMLAVIMSALNLMQRKLSRGESDIDRFVDAAMDGAQRASTLTQRLLAFSRQQPLSPETFAVNQLVAGMSELLTRSLGEQVKVETVLAAGLWQVRADPAQLENAILNLAVNARDAMPGGGKLTIETQNSFVDDVYAREYAIDPGQYVLIAVADAGAGMASDVIAKAFDPFFTTKAVGKGTGLGLSQVYGFVRQSGGHVKIYSEVGIGTSVKIYLPRHYQEIDEIKEITQIATIHGGLHSEVILVVEDDARVRALSTEALRDLGYSVVEASGPTQALQVLNDAQKIDLLFTDDSVVEASGPTQALQVLNDGQKIDLLFTDVVMPDMSGRELVERTRQKWPELKVLYTTGYTRNAIVHNGVLDPGTNLLSKPFSIEQLAAKVRKILDGEVS